MQATWTWTPQFETQGKTASAEEGFMQASVAGSDVAGSDVQTLTAREDTISDTTSFLQKKHPAAFAVLAQSPVIAVLLLGWKWIAARWQRSTPITERPSMKTLSHLALGGRKTITLVEVDGVRYLVGGGADTVTTIVAVTTEDPNCSLRAGEGA